MTPLQSLPRIGMALIFASASVYARADSADSDNERQRLAGIAKELLLIERLTYEAQAQAPSTSRVHFNYGVLRRDINLIRTGIEEHVQAPSMEPRRVAPLLGDYQQ